MVLHPGAVVGGYLIESILGSGGMGTVYRARHPVLPRSDALKVLSAELSRDEHFRARFEREAELAATLDHPNIVTVYNRGDTDGHLWIAMQYVAGSDAEKELTGGRMTPQRAAHIITEVAKALDYAHRQQLLHRDIKPANFLLGPQDERIFLADFGIARALDEAVGLTQTGMVMASVAYAAPESLVGEPTDHRADIYSLGCSLYRMLTGVSPFARTGGMAAVAAAHLMEAPPRATDTAPQLPTAIDAVLTRAMAKDPAHRFQTAGDLAAAAARALDETTDAVRITPTPAPPPRPDHTPPHWPTHPAGPGPRPYPPPHTAVGGAAWPTGPTHPAPHPPAPPPLSRPRRPRRALIAASLAAVVLLVAGAITVWMWPRDSQTPYPAQQLAHQHGTATLTEQPRAVVAAGPGDADALLSLDVQPVAVIAPDTQLPGWERDLITGDVAVLPDTNDTAAIAATKPDLIIDTAPIDGATYRSLSQIATTITRPQNANDWTWQTHLQWVGRILGRSDRAQELIDMAATAQADLREAHPAFDAKSIEMVLVTDNGVNLATPESGIARYLQGLGFRYPGQTPSATTSVAELQPVDAQQLNLTPTDVRVILRTDKAAGGGSYNGLPQPFSQYRGVTVIVDNPDTIAALQTPGYAATTYLNKTLIDALASQVR
ncbi:serine/threonine-protein kinase [Mycobacterium sp. pW049]|uniref:serine/threonine-protein kinase n=1 Tax=[Mycobacterium] bulgaricum TaxID=3238985 RepID=UPI00351B3C11